MAGAVNRERASTERNCTRVASLQAPVPFGEEDEEEGGPRVCCRSRS